MHMKKYFVILLLFLGVCSCSKTVTGELATTPSDSLMLTVMQSIMDTNHSYLDVKEELFMFIDTMQSHVEFHPDSKIRIGAKSFADLLAQLLLEPEFNTPEEMQFTIDSVIEPITDVRSTWYYQAYDDGSHSLSQHILKYNEQTNANDIVHLEVVADEKGELLIVSMPNKNYHFTSIAFSGDSIFEIDTIGFYRDDAKYIDILEDDSTEYVIFGSDCIEQMLSHQAIFIGYIDEDESKPLDERYQSCMHLLYKFKEQYAKHILPVKYADYERISH